MLVSVAQVASRFLTVGDGRIDKGFCGLKWQEMLEMTLESFFFFLRLDIFYLILFFQNICTTSKSKSL